MEPGVEDVEVEVDADIAVARSSASSRRGLHEADAVGLAQDRSPAIGRADCHSTAPRAGSSVPATRETGPTAPHAARKATSRPQEARRVCIGIVEVGVRVEAQHPRSGRIRGDRLAACDADRSSRGGQEREATDGERVLEPARTLESRPDAASRRSSFVARRRRLAGSWPTTWRHMNALGRPRTSGPRPYGVVVAMGSDTSGPARAVTAPPIAAPGLRRTP